MESIISEVEAMSEFFSVFFVGKVLVFIIVAVFLYKLGLRVFLFLDDKFFKKRMSRSGVYLFLRCSAPIFLLFSVIYWYFLKNNFLIIAFAIISLLTFAILFIRSFTNLFKLASLLLNGTINIGKTIEIDGRRSKLVNIGLFHIVGEGDNGIVEITPTSRLSGSTFSIPTYVSGVAIRVEVPYNKLLDLQSEAMVKRVLVTKPYVDKKGYIDVEGDGRKIDVQLKLADKSYEHYAKLDIIKTCEQIIGL